MELFNIIKEAPEWVGLAIALLWNNHLRQQLNHIQERLERVADRQEAMREKLIGKLTKTDLGD